MCLSVFVFLRGSLFQDGESPPASISFGGLLLYQVIKYYAYRFICVVPHYSEIVEDRSVLFHALPYTVFKHFQRNTQFKAMLNERFSGRVVSYLALYLEGFSQCFYASIYVSGEIGIGEFIPEVQSPCIPAHPSFNDWRSFWRYGNRYPFVPHLCIPALYSDILKAGNVTEIV